MAAFAGVVMIAVSDDRNRMPGIAVPPVPGTGGIVMVAAEAAGVNSAIKVRRSVEWA
ncbi:hypothetical protein [Acidomonas methanolica]|uniref:Uncharacterized protein n=1 Tax=Acidomonas methanolica NBRC 104435 TaxID=1231351 RepID=A0A023D9M7_ACIMT|nr:hypothetical protein [Acidomonas methanolica]GAJ30410.1 hypothetical protein Amme_134_002 [Acidomonas methanolica NBRC 104435]GEL00523.1 hypothetical protein AME01nite_30210 [Acidomonas methanolica NBRC 104435]